MTCTKCCCDRCARDDYETLHMLGKILRLERKVGFLEEKLEEHEAVEDGDNEMAGRWQRRLEALNKYLAKRRRE